MPRQLLSLNATLLPVAPGGSAAPFRALVHSDGQTPIQLDQPSPSPQEERFEVVKMQTVTVEYGAAPFLQELTWREVLGATTVVAAALSVELGPTGALLACGAALLTARALTALASRLCGGITGDTLGATNEIVEILFLLIAPAWLAVR